MKIATFNISINNNNSFPSTSNYACGALVPQIVDAINLPVIAAGGVTDARGIAAALALGASGAQLGTAYLFCPESKILGPHRTALCDDRTAGTRLH